MVGKIARKAGDKPQPGKMRDGFVNRIEQFGKRGLAAIAVIEVVMVDRLPEQRDFKHAGVGKALHLINDILRRTMHLRPARVWNHAVRAEFIATPRDANVRLRDVVLRGDAAGKVKQFEVIFSSRQRAEDRRLAAPISAT